MKKNVFFFSRIITLCSVNIFHSDFFKPLLLFEICSKIAKILPQTRTRPPYHLPKLFFAAKNGSVFIKSDLSVYFPSKIVHKRGKFCSVSCRKYFYFIKNHVTHTFRAILYRNTPPEMCFGWFWIVLSIRVVYRGNSPLRTPPSQNPAGQHLDEILKK